MNRRTIRSNCEPMCDFGASGHTPAMPIRHPGSIASTLEPALEGDGAAFLATYNGAWGHSKPCSKAQWAQIRPSFLEALGVFSHLAPKGLRNYATPYVRLAAWALEQGLPLEPKVLLSAQVCEAFLAGQREGTADMRSWLRRLARAHGVGVATTKIGYAKRPAPKPYSASECSALVRYARTLTNEYRRVGILTLLALGLGCGLAGASLRWVSAEDLHRHGSEWFMRSGRRCAKVRADYVELVREVCALRPEGHLIGTSSRNITERIVSWVTGRVGVPQLNPNRLRATYICRNLEEGAPLLDLVAWTGFRQLTSIVNYFDHVKVPPRVCPMEAVFEGGAK